MFKVGDRVRVRSDASTSFGGESLRGRVGKVVYSGADYSKLDIEDSCHRGIWNRELERCGLIKKQGGETS